MHGQYILNKKRKPIPAPDLDTWGHWMQNKDRIVKQEHVGKAFVSTVFLGLDHNFSHNGPPVLWETMVFDLPGNNWMTRCSGSWEQAEAMHERMVKRVKEEA